MFITICNHLFFRPGYLKTATFCKKHLLTVGMATGGSPIKVPCENEDLPDKENPPDFEEGALQGELGSTSALIIVRKISIPSLNFTNVSRRGEGYINCMTTVNDILASHGSLL